MSPSHVETITNETKFFQHMSKELWTVSCCWLRQASRVGTEDKAIACGKPVRAIPRASCLTAVFYNAKSFFSKYVQFWFTIQSNVSNCEAILSSSKDILSIMKKKCLRKIWWFGRMQHMQKKSHYNMSGPRLLRDRLCGPRTKSLETPDLKEYSMRWHNWWTGTKTE